jgi:hypothetical protein
LLQCDSLYACRVLALYQCSYLCVAACRCQRIANSCRTRYPRLSEVLKVCMANANTRGTACDCAVVPQGSALQCQKQAKQLNALLLSACTNKLPPTLNLDKLKAADSSCLAVLSASGQAVTLDTVINDLTEECVNVAASGGCFGTKRGPVSAVAARCSLAGQCAAKIIDTLECSGLSCLLNIVHYTCPRECYHHQQPQQQQHCLLIWQQNGNGWATAAGDGVMFYVMASSCGALQDQQ